MRDITNKNRKRKQKPRDCPKWIKSLSKGTIPLGLEIKDKIGN